jgi:hypothetical protein
MKKIILILLSFFIACSTSDNPDNPNNDKFNVSVTQDSATIVIDQIVTLTATSSETIKTMSFSTDGGLTYGNIYSRDFGKTVKLYLDFELVGEKKIVLRLENEDGEFVDKLVILSVGRGNAVKINSLKLNSFHNKGESWDPEFDPSDPNRLADVLFSFLKPKLDNLEGTRSNAPINSRIWYSSVVRMNESNLTWDIQNENLLINFEQLIPYIAFADDDGGNIGEDLMLGPPFQYIIPISDYTSTKPNSFTVIEPNINLQYELSISW